MPPNTVYVGRPTWFGNPFEPKHYYDAGYGGSYEIAIKHCVDAFDEWLKGERFTFDWRSPSQFKQWLESCREGRVSRLQELRGMNLACWCPLDKPCHADVLLELANA